MSEQLAKLEKKGGGEIVPYTAEFIARYNGAQCYGRLIFDATKISKISFTLSVNNARVPDNDGLRYVRVLSQTNAVVATITGTGAKEITVDPSWGIAKLTVFVTATADYGSVYLNDIVTE